MELAANPSPAAPSSERILSVDVLRGFDMFWIVGGEWVFSWTLDLCPTCLRDALMPQMFHVRWEGFRFMDLIFALFLFLVGMSSVFSLGKTVAEVGLGRAYLRVLRRTAILFLLGLVMYGGLTSGWPNVRVLGVLQRIAICYFFTAMAVIHLRPRGIIVLLVALLAGYWAFLSFVPLPGAETISFEVGKNWPNYVDAHYLPGRLYAGTWDPEGLLSTLPSIASCLLGALAAYLLKSQRISPWAKVGCLVGGGIVSVGLGYLWGLQFPVIKNLWTSSFVLVTGGYSCILLGLFYLVVNVWKLRGWTIPFVWIGTNALTIYMLHNLFSFDDLARRLVGKSECIAEFLLRIPTTSQWLHRWGGDEAMAATLGNSIGRVVIAYVSLGITLILVRFLYQRKIFLRA